MSTPPDMGQVAQDLYDELEPLAYDDENQGWALAHFCGAIGVGLEEIAELVRSDENGNEGWSAFADPARCPTSFLYTLAQWAGVRYPYRMAEGDLRALIGPHAPAVWRGTRDAIINAVRRYIGPDGSLYFEERADGDPYAIRIFTYAFDTPAEAEAMIRNELLGEIPAGLILDYEVRVGQTYGMAAAKCETYADLRDSYATYGDVRDDAPISDE